jgi:hypothetical protein
VRVERGNLATEHELLDEVMAKIWRSFQNSPRQIAFFDYYQLEGLRMYANACNALRFLLVSRRSAFPLAADLD